MSDSAERDRLKQAAAEKALELVEEGMTLGLGTGSTAALFVAALGERVRQGLRVVGIPTSERTARQAEALGIPLTTLAEAPSLDLTVDGADEVAPNCDLIKGLGGALLREKIVAAASRRLVIIVDEAKLVPVLGSGAPVPVEVVPFGWQSTARALAALGADYTLRLDGNEKPFLTDGSHYILDCRFGPIGDPATLEARLARTVGVVESGLFVGMASQVIVAGAAGVRVLDS